MPLQSLDLVPIPRLDQAECAEGFWRIRPGREVLYRPGWLYARYVREVMTMEEIAVLVGTSRQAVGRALERYGIPRRPAARRFVRRELTDPSWLRREYQQRRRTTVEIADQLGVTHTTVNAALRRHGIPRRPPRHQALRDLTQPLDP